MQTNNNNNNQNLIQQLVNEQRPNSINNINNINPLNQGIYSYTNNNQNIETQAWLSRYRLEIDHSVPVIREVRGVSVIDSEGIRVINQNQEIANAFINSIQSNSRNVVINSEISDVSNNYIINTQELISNNPNLNPQIMSVFLNNPELDNLLMGLRQNLNNFNQNGNFNELIRPFMNSFMVFLSTNAGLDVVSLNSFYEDLQEVLLSLNTLNLNQENLNLRNRVSQENSLNLDQFLINTQNLFDLLQREQTNNFQQVLNSTEVRLEEQHLQNIIHNNEIINTSTTRSIEIEQENIKEIEQKRIEILNKLKKLFFNKKLALLLLSALIATQTGFMLPLASIFRIVNFNTETFSSETLNTPVINSNNDIHFRDVYDLFLKKVFKYIKDL